MAEPVKVEQPAAAAAAASPSPDSAGKRAAFDEAKDDRRDAPTPTPTPSQPPLPPPPSGPSTFATPIGVIQPPPDLRLIVDRTADFVRRVGPEGEEQLVNKQRGQKKFAFLLPTSPYHAYYRQRVLLGAAAAASSADASSPSLNPPPPLEAVPPATTTPISDPTAQSDADRQRDADVPPAPLTLQQRLAALISSTSLPPTPPTQPPPPPPPRFHLPPPSHYSPSDLDIVHLTALYSSTLGPSFLHSLTQRERSNPQFDFLKQVHPLHAYYAHVEGVYGRVRGMGEGKGEGGDGVEGVVKGYRECVEGEGEGVGLARLLEQARWKRAKDEEEEKAAQARDEDEDAMAAIDWHSFTVVETIHFSPDEIPYLPPPKATIAEMEVLIAELAIEEERDKEERQRRAKEDDERAKQERDGLFLDASLPAGVAAVPAGEGILDHADEVLEIRPSLPLPPPPSQSLAAKLVTCVVCGDTIAAEDLEEHLRIELLDPKWKEQKQALIDRQRESSLVGGKSLSENLRRFEKKKREVGRERSREEEERQAREDAALLRGAAREQPLTAADAASPTAAATAAALPSVTPTPSLPVVLPPAAAAPPVAVPASSAGMEPPAKRLRPSSPQPLSPPSTLAPPPALPSAAPMPPPTLTPPLASAPIPEPLPPPLAAAPPASIKPPSAFVPESLWLSANPLPLSLLVHVPADASSPYNLQGQTLSIPLQLTDSIDALKAELSVRLNALPANRQQFQVVGGAFLKEGHSLAYYNLFDGCNVNLKLKERGGKKK